MERNNISKPHYLMSHECSINISEQNKKVIYENENEENNDEKHINDSPNIISYDCIKTIIEQMEKCICKIKIGENILGTAFFCEIPFPDKKMLPVLITNNHIINEDLLNKFDVNFSYLTQKDKDWKKIKLSNDRYSYTSETYDITIIEIKPMDEIKKFLKLDKILIEDTITDHLEGQTVYIIQYPEGDLSASFGILRKKLQDKKYEFLHSGSTRKGSSGSPILNLANNVIGIHKGPADSNNNKGSFLNDAIKEFISKKYKTENEKLLNNFNKKYKNNISSTEINSLNLSGGFIQDAGFKEFNKIEFKNLTNLNLEYNNITKIDSLTNNRSNNLENLNLSHNSISDIEPLNRTNFKNLVELNLSSNNISNIGLIEFLDLNKLKILNLGHNKKIKHINSLDKPEFKELSELNLEDNQISDINVFETAKFNKLKLLNLRHNKIKEIDSFKKAKFRELETLNLEKNKIGNISKLKDFGFIKQLKNLNFCSNDIKNITDLYFCKFEQLKTLNLKKNKIEDDETKRLKQYLKKYPNMDVKIDEKKNG